MTAAADHPYLRGELRCRDCEQCKPFDQFPTSRGTGNPLTRCCDCARQRRADLYRQRDGLGNVRKYNLARYGLTPDDYDRMHTEQGGVCAICGKAETATSKRGEQRALSVDHDHQTGSVRQLLCAACNYVVGFLEKNPVDPHLFLAYLDRHRKA